MSFGRLIGGFKSAKAVVVGDLMLDEYIFGSATRISPEAPVMVVCQTRVSRVPGGAANVARNLRALGARVGLCGVVGDDEAGRTLASELGTAVSAPRLVQDPSRPTTRKTRVVADAAHQVLRVDHEDTACISDHVARQVLEGLEAELDGTSVLVLSDYRKGVLTKAVIHEAIQLASVLGIPVVANAKPKGLEAYRGAHLVSLNRREALAAASVETADDFAALAEQIADRIGVKHVVITLGEDGMVGSNPRLWAPAKRVDVYDPAGAGDTVIAALALGAAMGEYSEDVLALAAALAASVVSQVGVATPSPESLEALSANLA